MLQRIARLAIAAPRRIIGVAVLVFIAAAVFGIPVADSLSPGGFQDPNSESARAIQVLTDKFGQSGQQMLILVTAPGGVNSEQARKVGTDLVDQLQRSPLVYNATSPWTAPPGASADLISTDGKSGLIVVNVKGGENYAQKNAQTLSDQFIHDRDGVTVRAGGPAMQYAQINKQNQEDLLLMETIALPLTFLVLVWVFGGLLAAALPMALGALAVVGSMTVLRLVTFTTDVSIFALNLSTALGVALAVDYTLLILSRYRDELAEGSDPEEALIRTMTTAGRTVLFSAVTVALSMSATVAFPMYFLKSFAYSGVATVAFVATASIVVTPAAIVLLGSRLDALNVRKLFRRPDPLHKPVEEFFWYRSSKFVMRRWAPIGLAVIALLLLLGLPFFSVKWGFPDDRVLPRSASSHQVGDELRNGFAHDSATAVPVVVPDARGLSPADLDKYAADLSRVPDVSGVSAPGGTFVGGNRVGPPAAGTGLADGSAFLTVSSTAPLFSQANDTQLVAVAPGGRAGRPIRGDGRRRNGQPRQRRCGDRPTSAGARDHGRHHVRAAVHAHRQRGAAAQGADVQRAVADSGVRFAGVDIPGRPSRRAGNNPERDAGGQHAGVVVLHRFWAVDGLRGVLDLPDPRILAGFRSRSTGKAERQRGARRQRRECGARRGPHRPGDHRGRVGDVDVVRRADRRARFVHADVRAGSDPRRVCGCDTGAHGPGARVHARDGPVELVGAQAVGVAA